MAGPIQVLLIEDDPMHAELIQRQLVRKHGGDVKVTWADRLSKGIDTLHGQTTDVILLDLGLPDSTMDKTLSRILPEAKSIPIVILSSLDDDEFGLRALHEGAQDYISKNWMDSELLFRSLRYAIERKGVLEELRKANQAKDEFLATLSHELRTPIGVIKGFAEILAQETLPDEEKKQAAEIIRRNAQMQTVLIEDMLDMSQIANGQMKLQKSPQDLVAIVEDVLESIRITAAGRDIKIKTTYDAPEIRATVDPIRVQQIIANLLSNALKFTPDKGEIEISLHQTFASIEIEVKDNGEGIDPSFLPYTFDRFTQQDSSTKRIHGGLGLGLAIVKSLTELHGGSVRVESEGRGKGARFFVSLPRD